MEQVKTLTSNQIPQPATISPQGAEVKLKINGTEHTVNISPWVTVLDVLRERLNLTGTKKGCNHGQCGACTVLINGKRINSCLALAVQYEGTEITTVEGLAEDELHPVQSAFIECDGFQCGYCTSGQIVSAVALLDEIRVGELSVVSQHIADINQSIRLTKAEIRERMSGNLCRCGAYPHIVNAVEQAYNQD